MPLDLKPPISTYFDAKNAHDADRVAALFTEDGRVHDERHDHRGRAAIRDWAEGTFRSPEFAGIRVPGIPVHYYRNPGTPGS
jgi:ketosteroid isomerase-like protein